jgi:hypothetical protein
VPRGMGSEDAMCRDDVGSWWTVVGGGGGMCWRGCATAVDHERGVACCFDWAVRGWDGDGDGSGNVLAYLWDWVDVMSLRHSARWLLLCRESLIIIKRPRRRVGLCRVAALL